MEAELFHPKRIQNHQNLKLFFSKMLHWLPTYIARRLIISYTANEKFHSNKIF